MRVSRAKEFDEESVAKRKVYHAIFVGTKELKKEKTTSSFLLGALNRASKIWWAEKKIITMGGRNGHSKRIEKLWTTFMAKSS